MTRRDALTGKWSAVYHEPAETSAETEILIDSGPRFSTEKDAEEAEVFAEDAAWAALAKAANRVKPSKKESKT